MAIYVPTLDELTTLGMQRVMANTPITNNTESSMARMIVEVMSAYCIEVWQDLADAEQQGNLSTAYGQSLDQIGAFFGVTRLQAQTATTYGGTSSVMFTNDGEASVTVPNGTRVWNPDNLNIAYFTVGSVTIAAGQTGYADVTAAQPGSYYNTGAGTITASNLPTAGVSVTNVLPITSGSDVESDTNYRARIAAHVALREGPSLQSLQQQLMALPGVRTVVFQNLARGTGTLDVLVLGWGATLDSATLAAVQSCLDQYAAVGISAVAKAPMTHPVDVSIYLTIAPGATVASVQNNATNAANGYLDNLPIEDGSGNGTLVFAALAAAVQLADPNIQNSSISLTVDNLPCLKADQTCNVGEQFIPRSVTAQ
jgi:uncharacterized phage protein gp47/JayE